MRRIIVMASVAAMFVVALGAGSAMAYPSAPRALPAAPRAQAPTGPGPGFCLNIDNDARAVCVLDVPSSPDCQRRIGIDNIISYWRCGVTPPPPAPPACLNLNHDQDFTCLFGAKPGGSCTNTFNVIVIHGYRCTRGGQRILPRL
ncbi:MAG TPA: hypothetical protein VKA30_03470 [Actinomycetota bacterium]|nr:hypothetical protein [Actinomycetota bacterium]